MAWNVLGAISWHGGRYGAALALVLVKTLRVGQAPEAQLSTLAAKIANEKRPGANCGSAAARR